MTEGTDHEELIETFAPECPSEETPETEVEEVRERLSILDDAYLMTDIAPWLGYDEETDQG